MSALTGVVVKGEGLGAKLGFPTANLNFEGKPPESGVWAVEVTGPGLVDRKAVCNVGVRPTFSASHSLQVEVHIPGFSGDLYGKSLQVVFVRKLRDERKFASVEDLKAQIARDVSDLLK